MKSESQLNQAFLEFIRRPYGRWDIVEGSCLVARQEYPRLDVEKIISEVSELAVTLRQRLRVGMPKTEKLGLLNQYFFGELGFEGNAENYGDPRNSYLPDVLERKLGIPISLSALYLKLAWETGIPLFGVNFPGHFLVAWKESEVEVERNLYIDVFNRGKILSREELGGMLAKRMGQAARIEPIRHLRNASVLDMLHRMLGNLKAIHASADRVARALWAAEWMILLKPQDLDSLRDKGMYCFSLGRNQEAEGALVEYLGKTRNPPDFSMVWKTLYEIRSQNPAHLN